MSICQGCGGIVGRDCYNPIECYQISLQDAHDLHIIEFLQRDLISAEERVIFLEQFILDSGLEIPYPIVEENNDEDWLPF